MSFSFKGYKILIDPKLKKHIKKNLPDGYREIFNKKVEYLANNFSHPSLNTKRYHVSAKILKQLEVSEVWEFYISGKEYRCIFYVSHCDGAIIIAFAGNHNQIKNKFK